MDSATALQYRVVVATENGVIKVVRIWEEEGAQKAEEQYQWGNQLKTREIESLCWGDTQDEVVVARKDGIIEFWQLSTGNIKRRAMDTTKKGRFVGVSYRGDKGLLVCDSETGMMHQWSAHGLDAQENCWEKAMEPEMSVKLSAPIHVAKVEPEPTLYRIAYGGKETDLKLWDIEAKKLAWGAKNVRNDFLDMRVPVWIKDIGFLPGAPNKIAVATEYHQVRLYDTKAQRRPVFNVEIGQNPFTSLSVRPNGNSVVVTDTMGYISEVDFRKGIVVGGYKGSSGSMNQVRFHPTLPIIASCGLDRYLRIHDSQTRSILHRLYLKQRLNGLLISDEERIVLPTKESKDDDEEGYDESEDSSEMEGAEEVGEDDEEDYYDDDEEEEEEEEEEQKVKGKKIKQVPQSRKRRLEELKVKQAAATKRAKKQTTEKGEKKKKPTTPTKTKTKKATAPTTKKGSSVGDKLRKLQQLQQMRKALNK